MAKTEAPLPAKYFVAVLYKEEEHFLSAHAELVKQWGSIDLEGVPRHFDVTAYYEPEMGTPLFRRLLSFEQLYDPTLIVAMKIGCNELEETLSRDGRRTVNLDAGYLDHNKYLLASAKEAGQKIYLDKGIYADLSGRYKAGGYVPFEWSFPDFKDGRYDLELLAMRKRYLAQIKPFRDVQRNR